MLRALSFLLAAAVFTLGLFWLMQQMVASPDSNTKVDQNSTYIDFVRLKQDGETRRKERHKVEPPKPQKPKLPKQSVNEASTPTPQMAVNMPQLDLDLSISQQSLLGDAVVGMGFGDSDVIPLVRMSAQYPQRAIRQKIEGYVTARLQINAEGTVDSVEIVEAQPRGVFEREAVRALYRYKFKPKMEDGKALEQQAIQTIEFKLGDL